MNFLLPIVAVAAVRDVVVAFVNEHNVRKDNDKFILGQFVCVVCTSIFNRLFRQPFILLYFVSLNSH